MARVRVSQFGMEVFYDRVATSPATITGVGVSQQGVEVFYSPIEPVRMSQFGMEVFYAEDDGVSPSPTPGGGGQRVFGHAS